MKYLAIFAAFFLVIGSYAAPHRHHRPRHRPHPSSASETFRRTSWQNIAAGGVAAGTVVAAYKISDGVEEGLKTIAREDPGSFTKAISPFTWLLPIILIAVLAYAGYVVWCKYQPKPNKERSNYENQQK